MKTTPLVSSANQRLAVSNAIGLGFQGLSFAITGNGARGAAFAGYLTNQIFKQSVVHEMTPSEKTHLRKLTHPVLKLATEAVSATQSSAIGSLSSLLSTVPSAAVVAQDAFPKLSRCWKEGLSLRTLGAGSLHLFNIACSALEVAQSFGSYPVPAPTWNTPKPPKPPGPTPKGSTPPAPNPPGAAPTGSNPPKPTAPSPAPSKPPATPKWQDPENPLLYFHPSLEGWKEIHNQELIYCGARTFVTPITPSVNPTKGCLTTEKVKPTIPPGAPDFFNYGKEKLNIGTERGQKVKAVYDQWLASQNPQPNKQTIGRKVEELWQTIPYKTTKETLLDYELRVLADRHNSTGMTAETMMRQYKSPICRIPQSKGCDTLEFDCQIQQRRHQIANCPEELAKYLSEEITFPTDRAKVEAAVLVSIIDTKCKESECEVVQGNLNYIHSNLAAITDALIAKQSTKKP